jgi:hypothetical protein
MSCARKICELAQLLGYNAVKTNMLVGQWRLDLVGLKRKLQNELDEGPQIPPENGSSKRSRRHNGRNGQPFKKIAGAEPQRHLRVRGERLDQQSAE